MKKRVFSVLLSLCLMLSLVPALSGTAEAAAAERAGLAVRRIKKDDSASTSAGGYPRMVNMQTMSLATGDFDGDGTDELAAAMGTYIVNE
jgi:hypothetical protein